MTGPTTPSERNKVNDNEITISFSDDEDSNYAPSLPQNTANIGPEIPAYLLKKKNVDTTKVNADIHSLQDTPDISIGPYIPPHLLKRKREDTVEVQEDDHSLQDISDISIGPYIPPHLLKRKHIEEETVEEEPTPDDFAPALPPDLLEQRKVTTPPTATTTVRRRRPIGPTLPSGPLPVDDDDDIIGPALPAEYNAEEDSVHSAIKAIEERARQSKEYMDSKDEREKKVERPEWMLLPPEVDYLKNATSSKSRQFTNRTMTDSERDSSGWTETPAEKERRMRESGKRSEDEEMNYSRLDYEKYKNIQSHNRNSRPLTLMEIHQQKKHKKGPASEDVTKRPFDREKDLMGGRQMNRKEKKELIKQSGQFSDKFGHGRSSFL
ncbi:hypothetical protein BDB01DRAFT_846836 [Pilobolus umbonatus]|nr:hypothetical protein BDB01DRAFT_846836 [Pilobolus umbonatus]